MHPSVLETIIYMHHGQYLRMRARSMTHKTPDTTGGQADADAGIPKENTSGDLVIRGRIDPDRTVAERCLVKETPW